MKPMLACEADLAKLIYPVIVSPKLDGIRAIVKDGVVLSRSLKPIRNKYVQKLFSHLEGYDGELVVGEPTAEDVFQKTTSGVMSGDGEPDVQFFVFDNFLAEGGYQQRINSVPLEYLWFFKTVYDETDLLAHYHNLLYKGYEGMMIRSLDGPYKMGRSTQKEGYLLKMKEFTDEEFLIVDFVEQLHNANEAKKNAVGRTERSSAKAGKIPKDTLGALVVEYKDTTFEVGTGFSDELRKEIWLNKEEYRGKLAKVRYQKSGQKDLPRFPTFIGVRSEDDL